MVWIGKIVSLSYIFYIHSLATLLGTVTFVLPSELARDWYPATSQKMCIPLLIVSGCWKFVAIAGKITLKSQSYETTDKSVIHWQPLVTKQNVYSPISWQPVPKQSLFHY